MIELRLKVSGFCYCSVCLPKENPQTNKTLFLLSLPCKSNFFELGACGLGHPSSYSFHGFLSILSFPFYSFHCKEGWNFRVGRNFEHISPGKGMDVFFISGGVLGSSRLQGEVLPLGFGDDWFAFLMSCLPGAAAQVPWLIWVSSSCCDRASRGSVLLGAREPLLIG